MYIQLFCESLLIHCSLHFCTHCSSSKPSHLHQMYFYTNFACSKYKMTKITIKNQCISDMKDCEIVLYALHSFIILSQGFCANSKTNKMTGNRFVLCIQTCNNQLAQLQLHQCQICSSCCSIIRSLHGHCYHYIPQALLPQIASSESSCCRCSLSSK